MTQVNVVPYEDFVPSTITLGACFNSDINIVNLANFLPVYHVYDEHKNRIKLISGSRESIKYYGPEKAIVSVCFKKIRRGMRTGAMNNMVSLDIQLGGKNVHLKVSSSAITSVGTSSIEFGEEVFKTVINHIESIQTYFDYNNSLSEEVLNKNIDLIINNCGTENELYTREEILENIKQFNYDNKVITTCLLYLEDHDEKDKYIEKLNLLKDKIYIYKENIKCYNFNIFNSVYHLTPLKIKNFRMPLHKFAPFLSNLGIVVEYHNWTSEGVNVCFDIEEEKPNSLNTAKEYRHRFTIHETTKIRQCSPTSKEEAYKNYLGMMNLLKMFFSNPNIDFTEYICTSEKKINNEKLLKKIVNKNGSVTK
jgi:hypothetical protein